MGDLLESQKQLRMENKSLQLQTAALEAELTRTRLERDAAVRAQADASQRLTQELERVAAQEPVAAQQQRLAHEDILNAAATQLRSQLTAVTEQLQEQRRRAAELERTLSASRQELQRTKAQLEAGGRQLQLVRWVMYFAPCYK